MKWFQNKKFNGAISVFLIIIIISNMALISVLVDGGRLRMARATAEMALDSAATSVLANYDQLLYDLYGLFATDSLDAKKIESLMENYVKKTLGEVVMDEKEVTWLTKKIMDATSSAINDAYLFDGYNFQTQKPVFHAPVMVEKADDDFSLGNMFWNGAFGNKSNPSQSTNLVSGGAVSLANTQMITSQIIDHMKFEAPMNLVSGTDDFIDKLKAIVEVKERIEITMEKIEVTKKGDELYKEANQLLQDIYKFNRRVAAFSVNGKYSNDNHGKISADIPVWDPRVMLEDFDQEVAETSRKYVDGEIAPDSRYQAYMDDVKTLTDRVSELQNDCSQLQKDAGDLRIRAENLIKEYEAYISLLESKTDPNDANRLTVYLPEIDLNKSTCAEIIKNLDLLLIGHDSMEKMLEAIKREISGLNHSYFEGCAQGVISYLEKQIADIESDEERTLTIDDLDFTFDDYLQTGGLGSYESNYPRGMREILGILDDCFSILHEQALVHEKLEKNIGQTIDKGKIKTDTKEAKEKVKEKVETEGLREFDPPSDLIVIYEENTSREWTKEIDEDELTSDNMSELLDAGLKFIEDITEILETARDSLYINEYAIAYFPNYVQHFKAIDSELAKTASNRYLADPEKYYDKFNASQAELEYIITGKDSAAESVSSMQGRLLAVRMVFNSVALMTDTGKIHQANALAVAAGPFAPAVAFVLLTAWALAESVSDVMRLINGEDVEIFKRGGDWRFSAKGFVEGVTKKVTGFVSDEVAKIIDKQINTAVQSIETATNNVIYDSYKMLSDNTQKAAETATGSLQEWSKNVHTVIDNIDDRQQAAELQTQTAEFDRVVSQVNGEINAARSEIDKCVKDTADQTIIAINQAVEQAADQLKKEVENVSTELSNELCTAISSSVSPLFEVGDPVGVDGKGMSITMNYMDYMRVFLLFCDNTTKVQRIQSLIQANIRYGARKDSKYDSHINFDLSTTYTSISAEMEGSIKFLLMSNVFMPANLKQDGRLKFKVSTSVGY